MSNMAVQKFRELEGKLEVHAQLLGWLMFQCDPEEREHLILLMMDSAPDAVPEDHHARKYIEGYHGEIKRIAECIEFLTKSKEEHLEERKKRIFRVPPSRDEN